jgi:hypothetical protein
LRWLLEQGDSYEFDNRRDVHTFTFLAFTSSDEAMQEVTYHALSALRFDHPLPLSAFLSTLVTLGAKPDLLKAAGFDAKVPNVQHMRTERESLLEEWLILVERLSQ